ncbi:MAG: sodium:calcium antiporter [Haloferacaceae archaeon]
MSSPGPVLALVPSPIDHLLLLVGSFVLLLAGAELFTNGVEWLGHRLGISESATGSVLAAVGTALPETMIPLIAIVRVTTGSGSQAAADEVGVGAILGAPFMLATIAMFLVGSSVLYFRNRRQSGAEMRFDAASTRRDLAFFLVGYTLAFVAALVHAESVSLLIGGGLVVLYVVYVYRSLKTEGLIDDEGLDALHLGAAVERAARPVPVVGSSRSHADDPHGLLVLAQALVALGVIVVGAHVFVGEVQWVSREVLQVPAAVVALLLAPLATELPEKFNSVIWISRGSDTLALGNITGAMAFQGTLPVTLGIVFTSWNLTLQWGTAGFLNAFSVVLALVGGAILYLRARNADDGSMSPRPFLLGGLLYALFFVVLLYHVVAFDLAVAGH